VAGGAATILSIARTILGTLSGRDIPVAALADARDALLRIA
jgi:hypothetical protein